MSRHSRTEVVFRNHDALIKRIKACELAIRAMRKGLMLAVKVKAAKR